MFAVLFLSFGAAALAQSVPAGWNLVKDSKGDCQLAVPADWNPFGDAAGAAVFHDPSTAIAVVTSQQGQVYKPLTEVQLKTIGVPKDKVFENSAARLFYQDRTATKADDSNAYSAMTAGKGGACSCHLVFGSAIAQDVARKIVLSLGPAGGRSPS
jgi:hypothetical protein